MPSDSDEATRARAPLSLGEAPTQLAAPDTRFDDSEATRMIAPRTPGPQRIGTRGHPSSAPPPMVPAPSTLPGTPAPSLVQSPIPSVVVQPQLLPQNVSMVPQLPLPSPLSVASPPSYQPHQMPPQLQQQMLAQQQLVAQQQMFAQQQQQRPQIMPQHAPRDATPTTQDAYDRPSVPPPSRGSHPQVAGFQRELPPGTLKPWMLVIGAFVMAALAFLITRLFVR
jgi:hypothetical protein